MQVSLHKNARTTPAIRRELQAATEPTQVLSRRYHLSPITVRKWRDRDSNADTSHRPYTLHANLSPAQECLVMELRKLLLLPLDVLLVVTHEFINEKVSRSGLDRCLRAATGSPGSRTWCPVMRLRRGPLGRSRTMSQASCTWT